MIFNSTVPQKRKSSLCQSSEYTYLLYFKPLNTSRLSLIIYHIKEHMYEQYNMINMFTNQIASSMGTNFALLIIKLFNIQLIKILNII